MEILAEALAFVNGQAAFHDHKGRTFAESNPRRSAQHAKFSTQFVALAGFLERQAQYVDKLEESLRRFPGAAGARQVQLSLRLEDIDGLPEELMRELSITEGDMVDFTIQALMQERGGVMSMDQLLIALFRKNGEIHKRASLNARLYRMTKKGALFDVPGRKGVYSLSPLSEEESMAIDKAAAESSQ